MVNCGYEPAVNGIYIYAKLGTGIAHEISHAFDAEGSKYDKDGNMNNWWTDEDRVAIW